MSDRIQAQPPRPTPVSSQDEYEAINLRKPRGGVSAWVWAIIAIAVLLPVGCMGLGGVFFFLKLASTSSPQPPAAAARAAPAPLPAPAPAER